MKKILIKLFGQSYRTSLLGIASIAMGLRSWHLVWVHEQTVSFNVFYVGSGPLALIFLGWALLHARDHKVSSKQSGIEK
jgi:hypothetical protein